MREGQTISWSSHHGDICRLKAVKVIGRGVSGRAVARASGKLHCPRRGKTEPGGAMFDRFLESRLAGWRGAAELVFRLATSLIFLVGGIGHFTHSTEMLARIQESPWAAQVQTISDPLILLHLSGAVFIVASLALIVGWSVRLAALAIFVTLVPITLAIHIAPGHAGPLFKNIAILGALVNFFVHGASCCALDRIGRKAQA